MTAANADAQRELNRLRLLAAIAAVIAIVACAVLLIHVLKGSAELYQIPLGIAINIASTLLVFLGAWILLAKRITPPAELDLTLLKTTAQSVADLATRVDSTLQAASQDQTQALAKVHLQLAELPSRFAQSAVRALGSIQWQIVLQDAREVHFVVQGWDRWMDDNEASMRKFLQSGGTFHLYIYDPDSDRNGHALADMASRLSKTPRDVQQEITGTVSRLRQLQAGLPQIIRDKNPVTIHYIKTVNWYFAVLARGRSYPGGGAARDLVVFSIYSHKRASVQRMPALVLYPDEDEEFDRWFEAELDHLRASATR